MATIMCLYFAMQEEDILEHINAKCHLCTCALLHSPVENTPLSHVTPYITKELPNGTVDVCFEPE